MKDETQHPQPILQIIVPPYKGERSLFREGGEHQILVAIAIL
ncbi:hypothetical protein [Cylindrospermopsis raciborskii]|nr:hypothetical protein [Cylindrospermopsis raciborskii]